jgi:hypothetical protein
VRSPQNILARRAKTIADDALARVFLSSISTQQYEVNLITDCGADPTGVQDIAPALNKAYAILSALGTPPTVGRTLTLYIPPGFYAIKTAPVPWDFGELVDKGSYLQIYGEGDASILSIQLANSTLSGLQLEVVQGVTYVHDLAIQGSVSSGSDCEYALFFTECNQVLVERVHCDWIASAAGNIGMDLGFFKMNRCLFTGCTTTLAPYGVLWIEDPQAFRIENTVFYNDALLNAQTHPTKQTSVNRWISSEGTFALGVESQCSEFLISGCTFEDAVQNAFVIQQGILPENFPLVRIERCQTTGAHMTGAGPIFSITDVDLVEIDGLVNVGLETSDTPQLVGLTGVRRASLRGVVGNPAAASNVVSVAAGCGYVDFEDCNAPILSNLSSSAQVTTWQGQLVAGGPDLGALSDIKTSTAAIAAGALVKPSGTGVTPLATTDRSSAMSGISLDAASGAGTNVRVARTDQPVTVLNDGTAAIVVGDKIIPSATAAGQVTHSTTTGTPTVGVALTAAAATAGAAFQMQFLPSVV